MSHNYWPKYVLRSPIFSYERYLEISSKETISESDYLSIIQNKVFGEALYLASPTLHSKVEKWLKGGIVDDKEIQKLKISLLKYYSRMCFRCTPFGMFAGVDIGSFSAEYKDKIKLKPVEYQKKKTRLDMFYLAELARHFSKDKAVREKISYNPNPSLYKVGQKYRYVEYTFENKKRRTEIIAIDVTEYLEKVLSASDDGLAYHDIINLLVDDEISFEESEYFINELIDSQILISELEPYVAGIDFLQHIIGILKRVPEMKIQLGVLLEIRSLLSQLDGSLGNDVNQYNKIVELVDQLEIAYEIGLLFQTDLKIETSQNQLPSHIGDQVMEAFEFLEKLTLPPPENNLTNFKEKFVEYYENESIPLGIALDPELGIGFAQTNQAKGLNPLIDDLSLPKNNKDYNEFIMSPLQMILDKEREKGDHTIKLDELNLDILPAVSNINLSNSMCGSFEILDIEGEDFIKFSGAGGSSAIYLLGRFCHLSEDIHSYCREVIQEENKIANDNISRNSIFAEIGHIPKSRMGNVINRPILRDYEIPYMANSLLPRDKQIRLQDMKVKVGNTGLLEVFSVKLGKYIIPRLASAHNYRLATSEPIYAFLGEMQSQGQKNGVGIDFSMFSKGKKFLPRITYKNILIKEATWNFQSDDILKLTSEMLDEKQLKTSISDFQAKWNLPEFVMLVDGDNELLIRLSCLDSVFMLLSTVKSRNNFTLREFFFPKKLLVDSEGRNMVHQFNLSIIRDINS